MHLVDYLLEHGLVPNPKVAKSLIMRGDVLVDDRPVTSCGVMVGQGVVRLRAGAGASGDVSRGAKKLRPVASQLGFACDSCICLDLGAADGGFTQVLLELGAAKVYCVDVGYGVLAHSLRTDERVVVLERTNARELSKAEVPEPVNRVVGDLSFISWQAVLPAITGLLDPGAEMLLLVKPQFELAASGKSALLDHGVLKDAGLAASCLDSLYNVWVENHLNPTAVVPAAITGAKGNQEYFVYLANGPAATSQAKYSVWVKQAVGVGRAQK